MREGVYSPKGVRSPSVYCPEKKREKRKERRSRGQIEVARAEMK